MKNLLLSSLFLLLACGQISAQKAPIKWGKVPDEDLGMTEYAPDPEAGAVVLCDYGYIKFDDSPRGLEYSFIRHKRVKILKRAGFDEADVTIGYHEAQIFSNFKAQIFAPDGSQIKLNKQDVYDEEVNTFWRRKRFTFPNVQEGAIIEYTYTINSGNLFTLREWFFQNYIPTRWSELRFEMIEYFKYTNVMRGNISLEVNESRSSVTQIRNGNLPTKINRWVAKDVPAMKREDFTACPDDYRGKMQFQLQSVQIPGEFAQTYEWPQLATTLIESFDFGVQYKDNSNFYKVKKAASTSLAGASTEMEKAQAIYDFVNQNVRWNGMYWYDTFQSLNRVFEDGEGYSAELNLMVLALLRANDIEAYPVLTSTRSNGKVNPYYPMLRQFNHTLIQAVIDGENFWLDAGDPMLPAGMPAEESLNSTGLLIDEKNNSFRWVDIVPEASKDVIYASAVLDESGELTANISCSHSGYSAYSERAACKTDESAKKVWKERLAARFPDAAVESVELENQPPTLANLKSKMQVSLPEAAMVSGDLMYLSPTLYSGFLENPFKVEERTLPIEFPYPFAEQLITNVTVPEGFIIDGLPENIRIALPEAAGSFQYRVSEAGGKVQITSKLDISKTFFLPEEYDALRNFFSMVEEKMGEQVVLKKRT